MSSIHPFHLCMITCNIYINTNLERKLPENSQSITFLLSSINTEDFTIDGLLYRNNT